MAEESRRKKIEEAVHNEVEKKNLHAMIDQILRDVIQEELGASGSVDAGAVVGQLLDSSAVQQLVERVANMNRKSQKSPSTINIPQNIRDQVAAGRQYLYLNILGGRAFVDHLGTSSGGLHQCSLVVHVALKTQRFQTRQITCVCDPQIQEGFLFDLQQLSPGHAPTLDATDLLLLHSPISLVVVRAGQHGANSTLISAHSLEWQSLLTQPSSSSKFVCQLMGIGSEQQVPVGLLDIEASIIPPLGNPIPHESLAEHSHSLEAQRGEKQRLFISYTREWWREYTEASKKHGRRMVRIFSIDEYGKNRFVCEFVKRLEVGQALKSSEEAARWVSVLPSNMSKQLPAGATDPWFTPYTAVMAGSLNTESKCSLLCSLLLGFGLDAWVCVGSRQSGQPHMWLMTRGPYTAITFWEATTGSRYLHRVGYRGAHDYAAVGSVFNNQAFYANCQVSDRIEYCSFVLEDASIWKKMSYTAISSIVEKGVGHLPVLSPRDDGAKRKINIESQLKSLISEHRKAHELSSHFDEHLSYVLTPALWSYEREAVDGGSLTENRGAELFSAALMNVVPEGYTFKGFPLYFTHSSPRRAFTSILSSSIGREIVECRGDRVSLAVCSVTVCYPECVYVTWVMLACTFRQVG